jgi:alkylation response protein AidB-like acyl-CoA dehydrogenase
MDEYPISRQFTDAKISTIYAGSSEVMKIIISRDCLGPTTSPSTRATSEGLATP